MCMLSKQEKATAEGAGSAFAKAKNKKTQHERIRSGEEKLRLAAIGAGFNTTFSSRDEATPRADVATLRVPRRYHDGEGVPVTGGI